MSGYVVIDLEFCKVPGSKRKAFNVKQEIIQIGAVLLNSEYEIVDQFSSYVKPAYGHIDPFIQNLQASAMMMSGMHLILVQYSADFSDGFLQMRCLCPGAIAIENSSLLKLLKRISYFRDWRIRAKHGPIARKSLEKNLIPGEGILWKKLLSQQTSSQKVRHMMALWMPITQPFCLQRCAQRRNSNLIPITKPHTTILKLKALHSQWAICFQV